MLTGKSAIVTGSTSGIGLAIAQALAGAGCNVMLNGFGDDDAIEGLRTAIETEHRVRASYCGADMTKPDEIAGLCLGSTGRRPWRWPEMPEDRPLSRS